MLTAPFKLKKLSSPSSKGTHAPSKLSYLLVVALLFGASPTAAANLFPPLGTDAMNLKAITGFEEQQHHRDLASEENIDCLGLGSDPCTVKDVYGSAEMVSSPRF